MHRSAGPRPPGDEPRGVPNRYRRRHTTAGPHIICTACSAAIPLHRTARRGDGARMIACSGCDAVYSWRVGGRSTGMYNPADQATLQ